VGRAWARAAVALLALLLAAACGAPARETVRGSSTTTVPDEPPSTAPAPATTTTALPTTTAAPATTTSPATTTTRAPATPTTTTEVLDPALARVGSAGQAVVVTAARYGATTATLSAYERVGDVWRRTFGPWTARVGTAGVAPAGEKREGDGRTPSGVYGFEFFFGVAPDPGVSFPYRRVTSRSIVWDDDPASPRYNTWVDLDREQAGVEPEPMYVSPAYDHGAVIAYNTARTPGLGSAIFLHVSTGGPTAGCVSLPAGQLVDVLRWLDPARAPRIVIGVA
jgi:L,D-peptidoglycan transpeptidase YkuD (ErfK/YbiS/YcfS/YnhG family)